MAGVPPDGLNSLGQFWGNPVYNWDALREDGYQWFIGRFRAALAQVDVVRLDHFRGFAAYWEIPASEPTAVKGRWVPAPGEALFKAVYISVNRELMQSTIMSLASCQATLHCLNCLVPRSTRRRRSTATR